MDIPRMAAGFVIRGLGAFVAAVSLMRDISSGNSGCLSRQPGRVATFQKSAGIQGQLVIFPSGHVHAFGLRQYGVASFIPRYMH